jgi:hypothetical protein
MLQNQPVSAKVALGIRLIGFGFLCDSFSLLRTTHLAPRLDESCIISSQLIESTAIDFSLGLLRVWWGGYIRAKEATTSETGGMTDIGSVSSKLAQQ